MDDNIRTHELFAYCITDGVLNDMSEKRRTALIRSIAKIREEMIKDSQHTDGD